MGEGRVETFREWRPPARLAPHVVCLWVRRVPAGSEPHLQRTVPNGSAEVVCTLGSTPQVVGPETRPTETLVPPGTTVVGARLRPTAGTALLGHPVGELVDTTVEPDVLSGGSSGARLADVLAQSTTDRDLLRHLSAYLATWVERSARLDPLAVEAVRRIGRGEAASLATLAGSLYVSERQLRRRMLTATGLGPKTLHRHLRFQRFLALASALPHPTGHLAMLAAQAGYADQAHLSRESVQLEGRPPHAVLRETEHHCRGAHDHAASYRPLLPGIPASGR